MTEYLTRPSVRSYIGEGSFGVAWPLHEEQAAPQAAVNATSICQVCGYVKLLESFKLANGKVTDRCEECRAERVASEEARHREQHSDRARRGCKFCRVET